MSFEIQKNFFCENCKVCGKRPVIEQNKKVWTIRCLTDTCKNAVVDSFINVEKWNYINNKENFGKVVSGNFKNSA
ncbi:hypothetical protein BEL04_07290 [Mucilaginibacter sp. PPCGB 2223]|uniref:hypothetical protein n=1 Tax=Mucilaginibacter sp. PPCGB 2223 TaxID=1886027 RepID=UPI00082691F2|nr:hypothetical protein [Mucilaginibacter sp. PPCGB 2223]OCX54069.1 hypothetical protein BEL04_07290 [Mucilaginibacter sp. PPCGB 2223]